MFRVSGFAIAVAVGLPLSAGVASAQVAGETDACDVFLFSQRDESSASSGYMNTCAAADVARRNAIFVPAAVQQALARSFGFEPPSTIEPAGIAGLDGARVGERLGRSSAITITPTADAPPAAAQNLWNGWLDGRYLHSDYARSAGDLDGPTVTGIAGLDYKLVSKVSLGMIVSAERSDLGSALTDLESTTLGAGPYLGIVLGEHLVVSANFMASHMNSSQAGGFLDYDTTRLQGSLGLNGYWYEGAWRLTPGLTLAWSKDWEQENHGLFPDRTIATGTLTPSLQVGNTIRLSDSATVEPFAGAMLDWTFLSDVHTSGFGTLSDQSTDLRLQAGFNFGFGQNAQLGLTGEAGGLLDGDLNTYSLEANLAVQF
jgi:hypothetical protein